MDEKIYLKQLLESEEKYLTFLIEHGKPENKLMRENMLEITKKELLEAKHYLHKHCQHEIVTDYIDTMNSTMKIKYCNNCGLTLR